VRLIANIFAINRRPMALAGAADADHIVAAPIDDEKRLSNSSLLSVTTR
jgi:hypothetical protein